MQVGLCSHHYYDQHKCSLQRLLLLARVVSKVALVLSFSLMRAVVLNFSAVTFETLAIDGVLFEIFVFEEL